MPEYPPCCIDERRKRSVRRVQPGVQVHDDAVVGLLDVWGQGGGLDDGYVVEQAGLRRGHARVARDGKGGSLVGLSVVVGQVTCVRAHLVDVGHCGRRAALELDHDDASAGENDDVSATSSLQGKLVFEDDGPTFRTAGVGHEARGEGSAHRFHLVPPGNYLRTSARLKEETLVVVPQRAEDCIGRSAEELAYGTCPAPAVAHDRNTGSGSGRATATVARWG